MLYILEGYRLVMSSPKLRRAVWGPVALAGALFLIILALGYVLLVPMIGGLLVSLGLPDVVGAAAATVLYAVAWVFLAGPVTLGIATFLSSFQWEAVSEEVERLATGRADSARMSRGALLMDSARRTVLSVAVGVASICLGPFAVVPVGLVALWEYTGPAYTRRGVHFAEQRQRIFRSGKWVSFWIVSGLLTLVPIVNVFALPSLIAGGTLLCLDAEGVGAP